MWKDERFPHFTQTNIMLKPLVVIFLGCYNKISQVEWLNQEKLIFL